MVAASNAASANPALSPPQLLAPSATGPGASGSPASAFPSCGKLAAQHPLASLAHLLSTPLPFSVVSVSNTEALTVRLAHVVATHG